MKQILPSLLIALLGVVACSPPQSPQSPSAATPAPPPHGGVGTVVRPADIALPQTPLDAYKDYQASLGRQPGLLAEQGPDGKPLFYYGRVFVRSRVELQSLDVLAFNHSVYPFFDEYDATRTGHPVTNGYFAGNWEYVVGSGIQWNVLIKYPGIVSAIQMNPRNPGPHPMLDGLQEGQPGGSLNAAMLAQQGMMLRLPVQVQKMAAACMAGTVQAQNFFDDVGNFFKDALSAAVNWIASKIQQLGGDIAAVLRTAYQGVSDAIDFLRQLGNAGVCLLSGQRSNAGYVYIVDPTSPPGPDRDMKRPFAPDAGFSEPVRNGKIRARGGPGGILLTSADIDGGGVYHLDDLCGNTTYTLSLQADIPAMWLTYNGYSTDQFDLGDVGANDQYSTWHADSFTGQWLIGAQLASEFAQTAYGFTPGQSKVVAGDFSEKVIGQFSHGVSITTCGQATLVEPLLLTVGAVALGPIGLVGSVIAAPLLDADTYALSSIETNPSPIGVTVHEYGHFTMCRAIDHFGGDLGSFLNNYVVQLLQNRTPPNDLFQPLRNTTESIADYFAYRVMGYTNYFSSSHDLQIDQNYPLPSNPDNPEPAPDQARHWIASRVSVMFDWTAAPALNPAALQLPSDVVQQAVAHIGNDVTTQNMASWLATQPAYGRPADGLCRIFKNHRWGDCNGYLAHDGATLDAPVNVQGVALSQSQIVWNWTPVSTLADHQVLVNAEGATFKDVQTVDAQAAQVVQTVAGRANQRVIGAVEARLTGAVPGRSARFAACTMAAPVQSPTLNAVPTGLSLAWGADTGTDYLVQRAEGGGAFATLATVMPSPTGQTYLDAGAAPGISYQYQVVARNCDGLETAGTAVAGSLPFDDARSLFVRAGVVGGDGTRARPYGAIGDALPQVTAIRQTILVAAGTYPERLRIKTPSVSIYGGYDAAFTKNDPVANKTFLIGDNSDWVVVFNGIDLARDVTHPLLYVEQGNVSLHDLSILPELRASCPVSGCYRLTLATAALRNQLTLENVRFQDPAGPEAPGVPGTGSQPAIGLRCGSTCTINDSSIDVSRVPQAAAAYGDAISAVGSTFIAGAGGRGVQAGTLIMDRCVVRASATEWSPTSGSSVLSTCGTRITNSLLGGSSIFSANFCPSPTLLINSLLFGEAFMGGQSQLINNIFIASNGLAVTFTEDLNYPAGNIIRNNLFMPIGTQAVIATTGQRSATGQPGISADAGMLNDPRIWFPSGTNNNVGGNLVESSLSAVFGDDTSATPIGHVFHQAALSPTIGQGTNSVPFVGITAPTDLDGIPRNDALRPGSVFDIGPYFLHP